MGFETPIPSYNLV